MINQALHNYLVQKVDPHKNAVIQAQESQEHLRKILQNKLESDGTLPSLLLGYDFLFGSAIRGTKPAPFDDIDLMLILDGSTLIATENGQQVGNAHGSGKNFNPVTSYQYLDDQGLISSQKILNKIRSLVSETYPRSEIRKDGQAINVWMESYGFGIDVVPAFKIDHIHSGTHYYIPYGSNSHMWQSSNPHVDLDWFEKEDTRLAGLLRPTARLMRKWNEVSNSGRLSGFHIDALAFRSLYGKNFSSIEQCINECFQQFEDLLNEYCPQFSGFSPHIDHKLSLQNRQMSSRAIRKAKEEIMQAKLNKLYGALSSELPAWNGIFNNALR